MDINTSNKNKTKRLSIFDMQKVAQEKGGQCLSIKYVNSKTKLLWQCTEGHKWETTYGSIRKGSWCPECGRRKTILSNTYSIENAQELAKKNGGKCLSKKYINSSTKLTWECTEGHKWKAIYNSIQQDSWCPKCGLKKSGLARRNSIEDAQELAKKHLGKCLSKIYISANNKLLWECSDGHQWESTYTNIQSGSWCPECDRKRKGLARTVTLEDAQKLAKEHDGLCLSKKYYKSNAKLKWQCTEGHTWEATYESVRRGSWCSKCSGNEMLTLEEMKEIAKSNNGKCLSKEYKNIMKKLKWECTEGHIWYARASHIKSGSWCPHCAGRYLSIEDMNEIAKKRGGHCLSEVYKNSHSKLAWKCKNDHIWETTYANIQSGKWCPICSSPYIGENLCRLAFESIFNCKFHKSYPKWLKSNEGYQLELDGYSKEFKIAFEHQGIQHFKYSKRFHKSKKDFINQRYRDNLKKYLCNKHNIILIEVPQVPDEVSLDELKSFIIQELNKNNYDSSSLDKEEPDYTKIYLNDKYSEILTDLKKRVEKHNGRMLSNKYLGSNIKLEFECKNGHKWKTLASNIKSGRWCPECAKINRNNSKKLSIKEMQLIADQKGGKCLSKKYINFHTKLEWECSEGHIWKAKPSHIKSGSWCPKCDSKRRGLARRKSIEDAQELAKQHGGKCLSKKYDVYPNKLLWQCSKGHKWLSTYTNIQSGRWCPECAKQIF